MSTSLRYENGSVQTLLSTELNSLAASTGSAVGSAFDNSAAGNNFFWADFELYVTYGTAPTAGQTVDLYLVEAIDGSNYADGSSTIQVATHYVGSWPLRNVNTAQRIVVRGVPLPPGPFKAHVLNSATQAMAASGNTVKMLPYREQGV